MYEEKISEWFGKLTSSRTYPIKLDETKALWDPIKDQLDIAEQIELLKRLVEKDVFRWLHLISNVFPELFSEDPDFLSLLDLVVYKIRNGEIF